MYNEIKENTRANREEQRPAGQTTEDEGGGGRRRVWRGCGQAGSVQGETAQGGEDKGQEDRGADTTTGTLDCALTVELGNIYRIYSIRSQACKRDQASISTLL